MRALFDKIRPLLPKRPAFWISLWIIWAVTLWFLSERQATPEGPEIPHLDKVAHFGYFGLGAVLLSSWLRLKNAQRTFLSIVLITTLTGAVVGALDEFHQTFVPGRSGNDPFDWLADLLGSLTGAICTLRLVFPRHQKANPSLNNVS